MSTSLRTLLTSISFNVIYLVTGTAILAVAFPVRDVSFYIYVISVSIVATVGPYFLLVISRHRSTPIIIAYLVTIIANMIGIYVCLSHWSAYNNIIFLGAWLLVSTYFFHRLVDTQISAVHKLWGWINAIIIFAIILAIPDINGISLHLQKVAAPTHFRIYLDESHIYRATEHSRAYVRPSERGRVGLHSPISSNRTDELNLLLKSATPTTPTSVTIRKIGYDNYLGYRRFTLHDIESGELAGAFRSANSIDNFRIRNIGTDVTIDPITEPLWIKLELPGNFSVSRLSSAYIVHMIRALVLWELVWFSFLFLAPLVPKKRLTGC